MKLTITTLNNTVYKFADKTVADDEKGIFRGRIKNQISLNRSFSELGSNVATITIQLINHDKIIPNNEKLWNAKAEIITDTDYKWVGKVTAYNNSGDGTLSLIATERTAPELTKNLPDEFIRLVTVDENVHSSALNVTVPMVVGGTTENPIPVKGILKNKTNGIYYLCVGEIQKIVNVRIGKETLTKAQAEAKGYMCYTGSASQSNEKGIAYIQITNESLRRNDDGSYVEIGAEVVGLKLGTCTEEQCRNGARFLYYLLKTASTGYCGWGLGIDESDIDTDSFNAAIANVELYNLKLDGIIYEQKTAQNWITEICRAIRGNYEISSDGKRRLYVQAQGTSQYVYNESNIELVANGLGAFTGRVYNCGVLQYAYNPITAQFMQSANYEDALSIADLDRQEFNGESYLIRDALTAQSILEYTCKNSLIAAETIAFSTRFLPENCKVGTIVTVNHTKGNINGLYRITSLTIGDHINQIEACKYDPNVFIVGTPSAQISWNNDEAEIVSTNQPGTASGLTLSSEMRTQADGTSIIAIKGNFTLPNGQYLGASIEYGEGASPTNWVSLGLIQNDRFEISPVKTSTLYSIRIRMLSTNAKSEYITGTITTIGDTTAPSAPTITVSAPSVPANIVQNLNLTVTVSLANPPEDMAGFNLYRGTTNVSGSSTLIGFLSAKNGKATFTDVTPTVGNYYYWAKSVDVWGNASAYSSVATHTQDTTAPSAPTISATVKQTTVNLTINLSTPPSDMAGFYLYRNSNNTSSTATLLAFISAKDGKATFTDLTPSIGNYYYWAKSVDVWGNNSAFSSVASVTTQAVVADEVAATALSMPTGSILRLSAKGCTTASIAQANGVIDVSGQNNNGTASSGIQIINDNHGIGYNFNASSQIISLNSIISIMQTAFQYSFLIKFKILNSNYGEIQFVNSIFATSGNSNLIFRTYNNKFELLAKPLNASEWSYNRSTDAPVANQIYTVVGTIDFTNGISKLYIGGELINQITIPTSETLDTIGRFTLGRESYSSGFNVYDFRIYPYLLSASEVKTLSMLPDEALFAQLTADLIGANVIKAKNLVKTEAIITETAQISQAIVKDLVVTNGITIGDLNTNVNTANTNASNAVSTANSANSTASSALSTAQTASSNASSALSTAQTASSNASTALSTANTASTNASTALSTAQTADSNASTALSTANTANTNASNALTNAATAQTTANTAVTNAATAQTTADTATTYATKLYGTCSTAAGTAAKVVALSGFKLFTGATISVKFTNANTVANPTLNVNSTGAKAIYAYGSALTATSAYNWTAGSTVSFVYNGTQWEIADSAGLSKANNAQSTANTASTNASNALTNAATAQTTADTATTYATKLYGTCSTAAGTAAKVVTLSGFKLFTGATISVKFTNANTVANPTLNVNSTGAKTIYANGSALTANKTWAAGDTVSFVYNGTQWEIDPTIIRLNGVMTTDYTNIQGGKIKTGIIASGSFNIDTYRSSGAGVQGTPTYDSANQRYHGGTFSITGSAYDLDYGEIHTPYFYSNSDGAGIKGHIEATSGKIGNFNIINGYLYTSGEGSTTDTPAISLYYNNTGENTVYDTIFSARRFNQRITSGDTIKEASLDNNLLFELRQYLNPYTEFASIYPTRIILDKYRGNSFSSNLTTSDRIGFLELTNSSIELNYSGSRKFGVVGTTGDLYAGGNITASGTITAPTFSGQLNHSINASWNQLYNAAVYSPTAITSGVDYLWGVKTKSANCWSGLGVFNDAFYFTFFNNNLSQNDYLNFLSIAADPSGVYLGSARGKVYINGSVGMGATNTSNTTSQGKWHNGIKFSNGLIINWGMSSVFTAGNKTDSQYFSYNFTSGTSYVTIATPYRSSASFTWVTVSSQAASYVNLTSNSYNGNNWCTQYFWVAIGY